MVSMNNKLEFNKRHLSTFLVWIMLITFMFGCSKNTQIVLTAGFEDGEIFRMGDISCYSGEVLCYLANIKNQYSSVFGNQIWSTSQNGIYLEDNVKETVLGRLVKIKMMKLMASEYGIELSENERELAQKAAEEYYSSLSKGEIECMDDITLQMVSGMYEDYVLAEKVYNYVISDVNTEISDDEARTVIVKQIQFSNVTAANEIYNRIVSGENFEDIYREFSSEADEELYYRKGELPEEMESEIFSLGKGECSNVIESEDSYYIVYCVSPNDVSKTDVTKLEIVKERQMQAFEEVYEEFSADKECYLNEKLWAETDYDLNNEDGGTSDFFDIYDKYFER